MKVNQRRTVVGGLIDHCVSAQPREIDAHVYFTCIYVFTLHRLLPLVSVPC